jgi:N-acetylmuramoyl-L-alanine amidase
MVYVPGERYRRGEYGASGPTYTRYAEVRGQPRLRFTRPERLRSEGLSREFASALVSAFRARGLAIHAEEPIRDHVVRQGRSWLPAVLRGNQVPIKVLLEVANVANREDARLLATPAQRDLMAEAVLDALLAFYRGRAGGPVS